MSQVVKFTGKQHEDI